MSTRHLLTISLLLPLVAIAISATAQAGSTIKDKSYWPNEARKSTQVGTVAQANPYSALAYDRAALRPLPATAGGGLGPHYQGGPKGR
jgi:hypothetical protein